MDTYIQEGNEVVFFYLPGKLNVGVAGVEVGCETLNGVLMKSRKGVIYKSVPNVGGKVRGTMGQ